MNFEPLAEKYKELNLSGRYITLESIEPLLRQWNTDNQLKIVGFCYSATFLSVIYGYYSWHYFKKFKSNNIFFTNLKTI